MMKVTVLPESLIGDPEAVAMLQAFYSRSHKPIKDRLEGMEDDLPKIKDALSKYYLGYGHNSIGDCGFSTVFIEGVSMLAAKLIQDTPLYNGQESSTRYIDFTKQGWVFDKDKPSLDLVNKDWITFSNKVKSRMVAVYGQDRPDNLDDKVWARYVDAKAFDVARGFLPSGMKTQVSFTGSLRILQDHMISLQQLGFPEIQEVATEVLNQLRLRYSSAIAAADSARAQPKENSHNYTSVFVDNVHSLLSSGVNSRLKFVPGINIPINPKRDPRDPAPRVYDFLGSVYFETYIDFGTWRDLQRHRRILSPFPYFGVLDKEQTLDQAPPHIHSWYINQLPDDLREEAIAFSQSQYHAVAQAYDWKPDFKSQYYFPLGTALVSSHKADLSAFIYMAELRSRPGSHEILRETVLDLADKLQTSLEVHGIKGLPMFIDKSENGGYNRGNSTITDGKGNQIE